MDASKSVALDYTNIKSYCRRGIARREMGRLEEAIDGMSSNYASYQVDLMADRYIVCVLIDFERAISLKPNKEAELQLKKTNEMLEAKVIFYLFVHTSFPLMAMTRELFC